MSEREEIKPEILEDPELKLMRGIAMYEYMIKGLKENPGNLKPSRIKALLNEAEAGLNNKQIELERLRNEK